MHTSNLKYYEFEMNYLVLVKSTYNILMLFLLNLFYKKYTKFMFKSRHFEIYKPYQQKEEDFIPYDWNTFLEVVL